MISIVSLLMITVLFWCIWILRAYAWVEYQDVRVKMLGSVLIAFAAAMTVCGYLVFRLARPSYMYAGRKKKILIAIGSLLAVMLLNFLMLSQVKDYGYTITSIVEVQNKESKGGNYYFEIKDSQKKMLAFDCDQNLYEQLKTDGTQYTIQYRRLNFGKHKVKLGFIDVKNAN
ncbi:hypothetical protein [[Clostridium] polysaccharolyticum]|uniref:hypothetical protein n=1 Tax=[Clostridium] polysaccharolyticum TaxID=29364 RepID=UPI000B894DE6|nr:hypothetical protein [[Clostridium] polysaccharolyticum]